MSFVQRISSNTCTCIEYFISLKLSLPDLKYALKILNEIEILLFST